MSFLVKLFSLVSMIVVLCSCATTLENGNRNIASTDQPSKVVCTVYSRQFEISEENQRLVADLTKDTYEPVSKVLSPYYKVELWTPGGRQAQVRVFNLVSNKVVFQHLIQRLDNLPKVSDGHKDIIFLGESYTGLFQYSMPILKGHSPELQLSCSKE